MTPIVDKICIEGFVSTAMSFHVQFDVLTHPSMQILSTIGVIQFFLLFKYDSNWLTVGYKTSSVILLDLNPLESWCLMSSFLLLHTCWHVKVDGYSCAKCSVNYKSFNEFPLASVHNVSLTTQPYFQLRPLWDVISFPASGSSSFNLWTHQHLTHCSSRRLK